MLFKNLSIDQIFKLKDFFYLIKLNDPKDLYDLQEIKNIINILLRG